MIEESTNYFLGRSKFGRHFTVVTLLFLAVLLGIVGYTIVTINKEKSMATLVDLGGRQRMLIQRHFAEVFLSSQGVPADYQSTRKSIRSTLQALLEGRGEEVDLETGRRQSVPALPSEDLRRKLRDQHDQFDQVIQLADDFLLSSREQSGTLGKLQTLRDRHTVLINTANEAVKKLNTHSEATLETMVKWESIIALCMGLLGIAVISQGVKGSRSFENEISERKRVEAALRKSELFLNSIVENLPHMIFVKDAQNLRFILFNKAGENLLGYPRQHMIGKTDYDFYPESEADFYTSKDREVLSGKVLLDIPEESIRTNSQGTRYLHTKKIPILDDQGIPQYLLGISEDITERKRTDLERDERELLLSLIFETGPGCIKRVAKDGTLLHMNPAGLEFIEAAKEIEAVGLSVFDLVVPEHVEAFRHIHNEVIQGKRQTLQFEIIGCKGGRRWMETYAAPFNNPITKEVEHLAVTHDITERKQSEERTKQLFQQNELILASAGDGIYGLDLAGRTTFVNPAAARMLGYEPHELVGLFMHTTVHHSYADGSPYPREECPMYAAFTDGTTHQIEDDVLWRKDGTSFPIEYVSTPIWQEGKLTGAVVTFRDITERKQAETTLRATEEMYRQILDSISDMVFVKDQNFRILWANQSFGSYYNMTNEELSGILDAEFNKPEFTRQYHEDDAYVLNTGKILDIPEEPVTRHDGQVHLFHTIKAPLFGENKEVMKLVGVARDITERKQAEEIFRKGERKFRAIYEQAPSGIAILNSLSGQFTQINQKYCDITGYSQEEMLDRTFQELTHPDDLQADLDLMQQLLTGQIGNFRMEKRYIRKNGEIIWVNLTCVPLWLEPTDARQHIAMVEDISYRKRGETALQDSEERYRALYENNPSMYFTVGQNGHVLSANEFGAQQLGYAVAELIGRPVINLFFEDDRAQVQQRFENCLQSPLAVFTWEFRKVRKDKSVLWVKEVARSVPNKDGEIVVLIVCGDISEHKATEKALKEWKALTESILGQLPKGFAYRCLNDKTWTIVYVSDGIEEVTGVPVSALLSGRTTYDMLMAPGENERVWPMVQDALAKRLPYENEHQIIARDGTQKWILARGRFIFDETGNLLYLDGLNVDITERKQAEERLRESEAKRIEALSQSDALKTALLSSVSHELRTPLTAIKSSVSSLMDHDSNSGEPMQQEFLHGIDQEINYMSRLVDNLLDMSQIEAGIMKHRREWYPLEDLIEGALRRTELTFGSRNIAVDIPDDISPVFVDGIEIQQVLINLLDNAVKYSKPESGIGIHVRSGAQEIQVEIVNEGGPILPEDQEKIFERFYRVRSQKEKAIRGTGLGLAICKGLVEAHGGRVWVQSIDETVRMTFTIPMEVQEKIFL